MARSTASELAHSGREAVNPDATRALRAEIHDDGVPLAWIAAVLLRDKRAIALFSLAGILLAVGIGVFRPTTFTSSFSFLPESTMEQSRSGLASLAGQFGIPLGALGGQAQPPQLYADLLVTRSVLLPIARDTFAISENGPRMPVSRYLDVDGSSPAVVEERTVRELREDVVSTTVASRTTGAVTVWVKTRSPAFSYGIATELIRALNNYNLTTRQSQAAAERRFAEGRLEAARGSLRAAEDELQRFLQGNRQWQGAPQLVFAHERLQREVTLQQQLVTRLAEQYEDARIREVRDTPVITILEDPAMPVLPDPRGRVRLLVVLTFLFTAAGVAFVLAREGWRRQRSLNPRDPSHAMLEAELGRVRATFPGL